MVFSFQAEVLQSLLLLIMSPCAHDIQMMEQDMGMVLVAILMISVSITALFQQQKSRRSITPPSNIKSHSSEAETSAKDDVSVARQSDDLWLYAYSVELLQ